jgi:hypothetical protein
VVSPCRSRQKVKVPANRLVSVAVDSTCV